MRWECERGVFGRESLSCRVCDVWCSPSVLGLRRMFVGSVKAVLATTSGASSSRSLTARYTAWAQPHIMVGSGLDSITNNDSSYTTQQHEASRDFTHSIRPQKCYGINHTAPTSHLPPPRPPRRSLPLLSAVPHTCDRLSIARLNHASCCCFHCTCEGYRASYAHSC